MTDTESSSLFEYALSDRSPVNEDEEILMELHSTLGMSRPPATLLRFPPPNASQTGNGSSMPLLPPR
ncbi:MAG: hypothetical protein M9934_01340 [Thermomicrobiales bacterium]|nr:hypothetical protein [Thermomicrobiales bacterium]